MNKLQYTRNCPNCNKILTYTAKSRWTKQNKTNAVCKKCSHILKPRKHTEESKLKLSLAAKLKYDNYTAEQWQKTRDDGRKYGLLQPKMTAEQRLAVSGAGNHFYGCHHTEKVKKQIGDRTRGKKQSLETKLKISNTLRKNNVNVGDSNGMKKPEFRLKARMKQIEHLKKQYPDIRPGYNKRGCEYFNRLNITNNWNLIHAENGGEYYIKGLGYWVDAYDKDKNIIVEYDERKHFKVTGELKDKDVYRMNEIIKHTNCLFYRYNEVTGELKRF